VVDGEDDEVDSDEEATLVKALRMGGGGEEVDGASGESTRGMTTLGSS